MEFKTGDRVVVTKKFRGLVKGAKGEIMYGRFDGPNTVTVRFQTGTMVSGIPKDVVKKQFPEPVEPPKDDFEVPKYTIQMSNTNLIIHLDHMTQRIRGENWRHYSSGTKKHVMVFLQDVSKSNRSSAIIHMANEALETADRFS
jgi:hypothetical protein